MTHLISHVNVIASKECYEHILHDINYNVPSHQESGNTDDHDVTLTTQEERTSKHRSALALPRWRAAAALWRLAYLRRFLP